MIYLDLKYFWISQWSVEKSGESFISFIWSQFFSRARVEINYLLIYKANNEDEDFVKCHHCVGL